MLSYDPFDPDVLADPFPVYRRLRDEAPAYYVERFGCWALSRFEDVFRASGDPERFSAAAGSAVGQLTTGAQPASSELFMTMDPPRHTPYRTLLKPFFAPRRVARLQPQVRALARAALDTRPPGTSLDAVKDYASRISAQVTCLILGLPVEDGPRLAEWVAVYEPVFHHRPEREDGDPVGLQQAASGQLFGYLLDQVRTRRAAPRRDDALDALLHSHPEGRALSDEEVAINLSGLVLGGVETVPKHFGSLTWWLHEFPEQRAKVVANPELLAPAVEETLRYDAPTHILGRRVRRPVELHGRALQPGQGVLFLYASANRDEREFAEPDVFDVTRRPARTLAFGAGTHLCLGLHVARLESRVMLDELLRRAPRYAIDRERAVRGRFAGIRGYRSVPLQLEG